MVRKMCLLVWLGLVAVEEGIIIQHYHTSRML